MYDNILFDLDGTLVNSEKGIFLSLHYAFDKCGISYDGDLHNFIGPAFIDSFPYFLKTDKDTTMKLIRFYREKYNAEGVFRTRLYNGISDLLSGLKKNGKRIALATTKPKYFAEIILEKKRIRQMFDFVSGSELDGSVNQKDEVIEIVFSKTDFTRSGSVLIGDTVYDCAGARKTGIDCIGVSYGYGNTADLLANGAKNIALSPKDLKKILLDH